MKRCSEVWEGIVALAEGRQDAEASQHIQGCATCEAKLAQLREIFALGDLKFFDAPKSLIGDVKAMMQPAPRRVLSLIRSSLGLAGARNAAVAGDFQVVVGDGELQVRLMFTRIGSEWEVLGKLSDTGWTLTRDGNGIEVGEQGRFSFRSDSLAQTSFTLERRGVSMTVPSAEELLASGADEPA
jgi:hypothetical protein